MSLEAFLSDDMIQRLHDFEEDCTYHYSADLEQSLNNMMENKINQTRDRCGSFTRILFLCVFYSMNYER